MVKTVLLLTFAVFVSSAPTESSDKKHSDKNSLGELIDELKMAMKDVPKDAEVSFNLNDNLQMNCISQKEREVFFCQAEQELSKEVSGMSGVQFDHFRTDKKLMRNLNMYNKHHVKTCKPAAEGQDEIPLHDFLKNLLTCVKIAFSQAK
ncbi:interleukin-13 [Garra rufa]|uniref:interleukin-13 n=1 Tax=Garra rufa TaxID=137080 RepID=UPI003CCEA415